MTNKSLGKGLGSLFGDSSDDASKSQTIDDKGLSSILGNSEQKVLQISPDNIVPNPQQPRRFFSERALNDLVLSIREHGILQPLVVTEIEKGKYELIAGERRLRASKILNLKTVPVIVRTASQLQKLELSLIENLQRENLTIVDRALAYKRLMDDFSMTHEQVAEKVGKSRSVVSNTVRVLSLPETVQKMLVDGQIPEAHAVFIMSIPDKDKQLQVAREAVEKKLSRFDIEALAKKHTPTSKVKTGKAAVRVDPVLKSYTDELSSLFQTNVKIHKKGKSIWSLSIDAYSREELKSIVDRILQLKKIL